MQVFLYKLFLKTELSKIHFMLTSVLDRFLWTNFVFFLVFVLLQEQA